MRKAQGSVPLPLSVKLPPKRVREKFLIIYELNGCQKAVNFLTKYYRVRTMRIVLDGRKVGRNCLGIYYKNTAWFTKSGLGKRVVLHELYHHLIKANGFELSIMEEEREANNYAQYFLR